MRAAVPNFPPHPPKSAPAKLCCAKAAKTLANRRPLRSGTFAGDAMATNDPQNAGPAAAGGRVMAATAPVTPTAATGDDNRALAPDIILFQYCIPKAPTAVNRAIWGKDLINPVTGGKGPNNAALEDGATKRLNTMNWSVHAHCAMKPNRPPTPTSQDFLSNRDIVRAHMNPNAAEGATPGITAVFAIPAKEPHSAARASFGGRTIAESRPMTLEDRTGPNFRK
mmetsp:Transcript_16879/g.21064  ORF Transcript_16879/g.21064 Transcript_16879/m.21064 type:complete len:224 (+) Transcript_16879:268-939(+)